ncbi:hypothetical protein STEG23_027225 [Scotinomys teguina]
MCSAAYGIRYAMAFKMATEVKGRTRGSIESYQKAVSFAQSLEVNKITEELNENSKRIARPAVVNLWRSEMLLSDFSVQKCADSYCHDQGIFPAM